MDGQYWKGDRIMSINGWLLTSDFWQFLEPWHGRWYEYKIFIASCTDNIYDLENERWLFRDMIDHVGIYGSRVAEGLSAFNVGLVSSLSSFVLHFIAIGQFKLESQSGNAKFGWKSTIFVPWDLDIWWMTLKNNRTHFLTYFKLCASFHRHLWIETGVMVW